MKIKLSLILLLFLSSIPLFDLLRQGLPVTHDGVDHVARIANFYQSLTEGNFIPRWAGNLNWGFGHPILMFLYPLPSYLASLFHFLGYSLVDSTKLVFALSYILSSLSMFLWLQTFLGKKAAFVGALLYIFAPYRFVDLYVRGAIGEHVAFIFPPLICYFLYKVAAGKNNFFLLGGAFSVAGLLLSHNAISLMFLPIFILYALYLLGQSKKKRIFLLFLSAMFFLGFSLAAFFWIPAFFEGKYTLRDIVTKNEYMTRFETLKRFIVSPWNYGGSGQFSVQVGVVQWLFVIAAPFVAFYLSMRKKREWQLVLGAFLLFCLTLFLMLRESLPLWQYVTTLQKFQFPWRFLSVTVFLTSFLGALVIWSLMKKLQPTSVIGVTLLLLLLNNSYWHPKSMNTTPDSFYSGVYNGTTDTGESAPIWSVRFMEKRPKTYAEIVTGEGKITLLKRTSTSREYTIDTEEESRVLENTLYFPGWKVRVDGNEVPIEFQDPNFRGLMTFYSPAGVHNISLTFVETKLRNVANMVSLFAFVFSASFALYLARKLWRHSQ